MAEFKYLSYVLVTSRYFVVAGLFYLIFYIIGSSRFSGIKIQEKSPSKRQMLLEILFSVQTIVIFLCVVQLIIYLRVNGYSMIYKEFSFYGIAYFILSTLSLIVFHDFYFYITHRMMHHKKLFFIHSRHHKSINPTPWAAFSFGPIEAIIQIAWLPIAVCVIPLHFYALMLWSLYMIVMNVIGHLGYEIYPKNFLQSFSGNIFLCSTHHNIHHSRSKTNFGLYFRFWDRLLGTEDVNYISTFNKIKS